MIKRNKKTIFALTVFVLIGLYIVSALIMQYRKKQAADYAFYSTFNIEIPGNFTVHGIDVSTHQDAILWDAVKRVNIENIKIDFAFIKATEGLKLVDNMFSKNWRKTGKENITHGAYHFFIATKSGSAQADNFIKTVKLEPGDLPPVLDIEQLYGASPESMRKEIKIWLKKVEEHYRVKPIIYTYINFYEKYLGSEFDEYPLWIAHYLQKDKPRIGRDWYFWQHSESGNITGIKSKVDFNVFNGDSTDFKKLLIK